MANRVIVRINKAGTGGGGGGSNPPALNVTSATANVFYKAWFNIQRIGFSGTITLPGTSLAVTHQKTILVLAVDPNGNAEEIDRLDSPFTSTTVSYSGVTSTEQPTSPQTWSVKFVCENEFGEPTSSPYTVTGITVGPASVSAVSGQDASALSTGDPNYHARFQDAEEAEHVVVNATISMGGGQYPQIATLWTNSPTYGRIWHGWFDILSDNYVVPIGLAGSNTALYPPVQGDESWTLIAAPGVVFREADVPSNAVTSAPFLVAAPHAATSHEASHIWMDGPTYTQDSNGGEDWGWTIYADLPYDDPDFVYGRLVLHTGQIVSGNLVPGGEHPDGQVVTDDVGDWCIRIPGTNTVQITNPNMWPVPPQYLADGTPNPNNAFRFTFLVGTKRDPFGNGALSVTQQNEWSSAPGVSTPGTADHLDVILDLSKSQPPGSNVAHPPVPSFSAITAAAQANFSPNGHDWWVAFSGSFTAPASPQLRNVAAVRVYKTGPGGGKTQIAAVYGPFTAGNNYAWSSIPSDLLSTSAGAWTIDLVPVNAFEDAGTARSLTVNINAVTVTGLTAREVPGSRFVDSQRGLKTVIGYTPTLSYNPGGPSGVQHISVWFTYDRGNGGVGLQDMDQGSYTVTGTGGVELTITGIYLTTLASTTFKVSVVPRYDTSASPPADAVSYTFTLNGPGNAAANLISGGSINKLLYWRNGWLPDIISFTAPFTGHPELFSARLFVEEGKYAGGVWTPNPLKPDARNFTDAQVTGGTTWAVVVSGDSVSIKSAGYPWSVPDVTNVTTFRISIQAQTANGVWVVQATPWSGTTANEFQYVGQYCYITPDLTKIKTAPTDWDPAFLGGGLYVDDGGKLKEGTSDNPSNMAENGIFEDGALGQIPSGWVNGASQSGTSILVSSPVYSGQKSVQMTGLHSSMVQFFKVRQSDQYYLEAWFSFDPGATGFGRLLFSWASQPANNGDLGNSTPEPDIDNTGRNPNTGITWPSVVVGGRTWYKVSVQGIVPTGASYFRVFVGVNNNTSGNWYVDNLLLRPIVAGSQMALAGPLYANAGDFVDIKLTSDFVVVNGQLSQSAVDLAKAYNFDTSQFDKTTGALLIKALAVNKLIAGDALFLGQTTFASNAGGKVTLNSTGVRLDDSNVSAQSSLILTSGGVVASRGANSLSINSGGILIQGPAGQASLTSTGITLSNGSNSVNITSSNITISNGSTTLTLTSSSATIASSLGTITIGELVRGNLIDCPGTIRANGYRVPAVPDSDGFGLSTVTPTIQATTGTFRLTISGGLITKLQILS